MRLELCGRVHELDPARPWLVGIVNATPDSFSGDSSPGETVEDRVAHARRLLADGADLIDVGGESGATDRPPVSVEEEIARVVPVVERVVGELGALVSVDTYKPEVARAAVDAGAVLVNDFSGLSHPGLAGVCAETGAGLVLTHNRARPKAKLLDPAWDGRIREDVLAVLAERIDDAAQLGVAREQLVLDPGPDLGKTPAQTVEALRALRAVCDLGRPVLAAVSRKDFLGVITGRAPRDRGPGTLAAVAHAVETGVTMIRVHDVAATHDFLAVRAVLRGAQDVLADARLDPGLRRERPSSPGGTLAP